MTGFGNRDYDLADARAEQERQAGIAAAQAALAGEGTTACVDCGEQIDEMRRRFLPSARRCTLCQQRVEFGGKR